MKPVRLGTWRCLGFNCVEYNDLPKRPRALAMIPRKEKSLEAAKTRLEKQNPILLIEDSKPLGGLYSLAEKLQKMLHGILY